MIPILYPAEEIKFDTNGICRLVDCISCTVTEELNGIYEAEFKYLITGQYYSEIKERRIVLLKHDNTIDLQPFDIYKRSAPLNGVVTFYAHHISYRLRYSLVRPFKASSVVEALQYLKLYSITDNPFTFWTDKSGTGKFVVDAPKSVRSLLTGVDNGSITDIFGKGEYQFDKFIVRLYAHRGVDSGVTVRYGKNMTDLTQEYDVSETYTAVAPYWISRSSNEDEEPEIVILDEFVYSPKLEKTLGVLEGISPVLSATELSVRDKTGSSDTIAARNNGANSDLMVSTKIGDEVVEITDENGHPIEATYAIIETVPLDLSSSFDEKPTKAQLKKQAQDILNDSQAWVPTENITVNFAALWQTPEYENVANLERVRLADTVDVYYPALGVNVVKQQVIKVKYNTLLDRYDSLELGAATASFADLVSADIKNSVKDLPTKTFMQAAIDYATELIRGGLGGHVVIPESNDEILIMDTDSTATAVNVLRINMNGIGFSRNGYNGPFQTAWTLDGHFVADFIDTGQLQASLIKVGTLMDAKGLNYWNMETGEFKLQGYATTNDAAQAEVNAKNYAADKGAQILVNANTYTDEQVYAGIDNYNKLLDLEEVFNNITNKGKTKGIYFQEVGDEGMQLLINASYLKTGVLDASIIKAGVLEGKENKDNWWNLKSGDLHISAGKVYTTSGNVQSDMNALNNDISTINENLGHAESEIGELQNDWANTQTDIRKLQSQEVGNENLIVGTLYPNVSTAEKRPHIDGQTTNTAVSAGSLTALLEHGFRITSTDAGVRPYIIFGSTSISSGSLNGLRAGSTYTLAFDLQFKLLSGSLADQSDYAVRAYLYDNHEDSDKFAVSEFKDLRTIKYSDRGAGRIERNAQFSFTVPSSATKLYLRITCSHTETTAAYGAGDYIQLTNLRLQHGNTASAWSASPKDVEAASEATAKTLDAAVLSAADANAQQMVGELESSTNARFDVTNGNVASVQSTVESTTNIVYKAIRDDIILTYDVNYESQTKVIYNAKIFQKRLNSTTNQYEDVDVTDEMGDYQFKWFKVTEDSRDLIGNPITIEGEPYTQWNTKTITINPQDFALGGTLMLVFTTFESQDLVIKAKGSSTTGIIAVHRNHQSTDPDGTLPSDTYELSARISKE